MKQKILSVRIEHALDASPDYSDLEGEFTSKIPLEGYYLDRKEGVMKCGDAIVADNIWTHFNHHDRDYIAGFQQHTSSINWNHVSDKDINEAYLNCRYRLNRKHENKRGNLFEKYGVVGWKDAQTRNQKIQVLNVVYCCEDATRLERLIFGDWHYLGIIAKAEIKLSENSPIQVIHSGGLWDVPSDCEEYIKEVEKNELLSLKRELEALRFGDRAIEYAFRKVETVKP